MGKEALKRFDCQQGKFRSFLLAALTNFLHNERAARQCVRRGGRRSVISLDQLAAITPPSGNLFVRLQAQ
ncbi:hypothetical protein SBV1_1930038 [Verrucomicrobia bacterium]|nr:hypothetical protein SBV1_1930038 [Verrucomicrobiota bacterium]